MKTRSDVRVQSTASGGGSSNRFDVIEPGRYIARIVKAKQSKFQGSFKGKGKFTYAKFTPEFELINDNQTLINRQDFVLGAVDDEGYLFRPDGDDSKPALFAEAAFLIGAAGFEDDEGNVDLAAFEPELLLGQHVVVIVETSEYEKDGETRQKNVIKRVFPLRESEGEDLELYHAANGMWFADEDAAERFYSVEDDLRFGVEEY